MELTEKNCPLSLVKARGYRHDAERDCVAATDTYLDCVGLFGAERLERGCMRRLADDAIFAHVNTEMSVDDFAPCTTAEQASVDAAPECPE